MLAVVSVAQLLCCHSDYQLFGKPLRFLHGCACALGAAVSAVASGDAFPATQARTRDSGHPTSLSPPRPGHVWLTLWIKLKCRQQKRKLRCSNPNFCFLRGLGVPSHALIVLLCLNCLHLLDTSSAIVIYRVDHSNTYIKVQIQTQLLPWIAP